MSLEQDFLSAKERVTQLPQKPDSAELLNLYSLYKQGTEGDASGERPGMIDFIKRAKFDAWAALKGKSKQEAMQEYVNLVKTLEEKSK